MLLSLQSAALGLLAALFAGSPGIAGPPPGDGKANPRLATGGNGMVALPRTLPLTRLPPAKLFPGICRLNYRVSTTVPECQAFFDQGLGFFYSYDWMEAARSFETATCYDRDCALAWWGLSRALERWERADPNKPLRQAYELRDRASQREQLLIMARMQEQGLAVGHGLGVGKKAAIATIDQLLALYDEDAEAWMYRAQLSGDGGWLNLKARRAAQGQPLADMTAPVPFYKALLRLNPLHPGANHELVHFYENYQRPALGWRYAENYIKSSPGIGHAWHMQVHLASRLGRWEIATANALHAVNLQRAYYHAIGFMPTEDGQFSHHHEVLMLALTHDGRFREARALQKECRGLGYQHSLAWFRLHFAERDWRAALEVAGEVRASDQPTASYLAALVHLARNELPEALRQIKVLEVAHQRRPDDFDLQCQLGETRGLLLCRTGRPGQGLALLAKVVQQTKDDYKHHAFGNGAYYMEVWGLAALAASRADEAEEAFLEALAHDPGSARAAMGLQVLCEKQGRNDEARQYAELARRFWKFADPGVFEAELASIRLRMGPCVPKADKPVLKEHHR